jgi:ABC-2 type transport system permease protein
MKKYFEIGKINFLNNIQYFSEFFFKAIFILLILFIFTNIWKTIYSGTAVIEGFTIAMMVWYLLMTESIVTSASPIVKDVNKDIQSGDVAYQLNKPYNYVFYHLSKSFSHRIIGFLMTFLIGAILIYFMVGGISFSWITLPFIVITIVLALVLDFFMMMSIALLAFWFEDTNSFRWIYEKILFTIGGMLVPLEIFPKWLANISNVLPFSFVAYHPAKLFVNFDMNNFLKVIGVQSVYIIIFLAVALIIYKVGARRVNINGG